MKKEWLKWWIWLWGTCIFVLGYWIGGCVRSGSLEQNARGTSKTSVSQGLKSLSSKRLGKGRAVRIRRKVLKLKRNCRNWRAVFRSKGLLFGTSERKRLIQKAIKRKQPKVRGNHRVLVHRYPKLTQEIDRVRACLKKRYRKIRSKRQRMRFLQEVRVISRGLLEEAVFPVWLGTTWGFYGTAEEPHKGKVACGYFVVNTLRGLGFRFPENHIARTRVGNKRIFDFAKLPAGRMIRKLAHRTDIKAFSRKPIASLLPSLQKLGEGIYILGLDFHVGFILYDGKKAYFWHSSYEGDGKIGWVKRERLVRSTVAGSSKYRVFGKLSLATHQGWLLGKPIRVRSK